MISVMAGSVKYRSVNRDDRRKRLYAIITAVTVCLVIFICIILAIVLQKGPTTVLFVSQPNGYQQPMVHTSCGMVLGSSERGSRRNISVFKGIPYAVPPLKTMRWKPPRDLKEANQCWQGVYNATKFQSNCLQKDWSDQMFGDEDCLYLNIWTPGFGILQKYPVAVVLFSNALMSGDSHSVNGYSPINFVEENNVVVVTVSFRLGSLGFLALDALSKHSDHGTSGNYGLFDILQALTWVKANIASFGGNPEMTTLVGFSSGGTAALALSISPMAKDLFQGVISMSGAILFTTTIKEASTTNKVFVKSSGCEKTTENETLACLLHLTPEQVLNASPTINYPYWGSKIKFSFPEKGVLQGSLPVIDGVLIRDSIYKSSLARNDLRILLGSASHEIDPSDGLMHGLNQSWTSYLPFLIKNLEVFSSGVVNEVLRIYPNQSSQSGNSSYNPLDSYSLIATDIRETCPLNAVAHKLAENYPANIYRYVVTNSPKYPITFTRSTYPQYRAFHGWDVMALFASKEHASSAEHPSARDLEFMKTFRKEVLSFISRGKPYTQGWTSIPHSTTLFTNDGLRILDSEDYGFERCKLWATRGFSNYGWNT